MKKLLLFCTLYAALIAARGQEVVARRINFNPIDKDSLDLALNDQFMLIEDSCATVTRHVRFDFEKRKFHGRFTDTRKDNPAVTLTEGNYNADGQKDGTFTLRYTSGNIKAKGNFKADAFDGKWELYYDNGKPELTFEANNGLYNITDAWDDKGSKFVDKGNGAYTAEATPLVWQGKLVNGRPDGAWKMYMSNDRGKNTMATEHFKKGEFVKGENQIGSYTDASRIALVSNELFPFINTEKLLIGLPCNMASLQHNFVNAHYKGGMDSFNHRLGEALSGFFNLGYLEGQEGEFDIVGDITTEGDIVNLTRRGGSNLERTTSGIIRIIAGLPRLIPATRDGKPVPERFKIVLDLSKGSYSYKFQFMSIMLTN